MFGYDIDLACGCGGCMFGWDQFSGCPPYDMLEVVLTVAGVRPPETFESLPYVEFAVEGDGCQNPEEEGEVSAMEEEGKNPGVCHWVSRGGG